MALRHTTDNQEINARATVQEIAARVTGQVAAATAAFQVIVAVLHSFGSYQPEFNQLVNGYMVDGDAVN